ncbi:hypothetical protein DSECCO2_568380 [anaerobic digester metagenome]
MVYGKERLYADLQQMGYIVEYQNDSNGLDYVTIKDHVIDIGQFKGRVIDLSLLVRSDYPRTIGSCIHVKSDPILLDYNDSDRIKRNIIKSNLGEEWRYWSFTFNLSSDNPTQDLMAQINGIFRNI